MPGPKISASELTGTEFRELGMSLANQLPSEALAAMLPDHWAAAHPKQVLVHRIEEARQVANRKRDDRQKRRGKIAAADVRSGSVKRNAVGTNGFPGRLRKLKQTDGKSVQNRIGLSTKWCVPIVFGTSIAVESCVLGF